MAVALPSMLKTFLEFHFCGELLLIDPAGILYWPDQKLLVVSDLHLEKGSSFAAHHKTMLPPYDTHKTLEKLSRCTNVWNPAVVISLGDSFHDLNASARLPKHCKELLSNLMAQREWIWVCGNHDPLPPEELGGSFCFDVQIGPLNFLHEPKERFKTGEIAGHFHPAAKIRQRGKTIRKRCMACDGRRIVMPAFGAFTGGLNVRDPAYDGLFDWPNLSAWLLGQDAVYKIDGNRLCL